MTVVSDQVVHPLSVPACRAQNCALVLLRVDAVEGPDAARGAAHETVDGDGVGATEVRDGARPVRDAGVADKGKDPGYWREARPDDAWMR